MPAYIYLAAGGVVLSLFLLRWAFAGGQRTHAAVHANLGPVAVRSSLERNSGSWFSHRAGRFPLIGGNDALTRKIARAGLPWTAANVQFFRVAALAMSLLLGSLLAVATGSIAILLVAGLVGAAAMLLPGGFITSRGDERQRQLELQLPDILDRLTISIEAGLGFDSALAHVVTAKEGPGYDEFRRVLQDLQLGVPRDVALSTLSERTTVKDLRIVLSAILQSGKYGLPLAGVLRVQTTELRDKRWTRAQETAMKIPVKILFPLIFCILPTLFLVILGPAVIRISNTF